MSTFLFLPWDIGQGRLVVAIKWQGTAFDQGGQIFQGGFQEKFTLCSWMFIADSATDEVDVKHSAGANSVDSTGGAAAQGARLVDFGSSADVSTHVAASAVDTSRDALNEDCGLTSKLAINAITVQPVLEHLKPGWNQISSDLFAITTTVPEYVDTVASNDTGQIYRWLAHV